MKTSFRWLTYLAAIDLGLMATGCVPLSGDAANGSTGHVHTGQHSHGLSKVITKTVEVDYLLYVPKDYGTSDEPLPLMLFLHGAGERGDNLEKVKKHGPPKLVDQEDALPFIVVSPQCPKDQHWDTDILMALLDDIIANYRVDENRVYLTGLSMGGYGTWELAIANPDRFAAIAPICGGGSSWKTRRIKDIPVWVFHGEKDNVVPIEQSQAMVDALIEYGGNVKFTKYQEAKHDSWTKTYDNPDLYEWFQEHRKDDGKK